MNKEELFGLTRKYFSLTENEVDNYLEKTNHSKQDLQRMVYMFNAILPYCDKFIDITDEKVRRKVGQIFLSTLDYSKFDKMETPIDTFYRLKRLFGQTTNYGINPYKIIYRSVLVDGNLKNDFENRTKEEDYTREFLNIYAYLKSTLDISDEETVAMFEKCSSLISKVYSFRIQEIYNKMTHLYVRGFEYPIFRQNEVVDVLKINPSLFMASADKIQNAFSYILEKMESLLHDSINNVSYPEMQVISLRKWLKNNSTLLSLNTECIIDKENYIKKYLNSTLNYKYNDQFAKLFQSPKNLAIINKIPADKLKTNALRNILLIESITSTENVGKYILSNQLILGMDNSDFSNLIEQIKLLAEKEPENNFIERFLSYGKTLFASKVDFKVSDIIEKLKNNNIIIDIDVESLNERDYVSKFVELFCDNNFEIALKIEELIRQKNQRANMGEKILRKRIRETGQEVRNVGKILKDSRFSLREKRDRILKIQTDVNNLKESRFSLAGGVLNFDEVIYTERKNGQEIENILNILRDTYQQKKAKIEKRYMNADVLFDCMMEYLGECFDDKEAICDLVRKEITHPFIETVKDSFPCADNLQPFLFNENIDVSVPIQLKKPLKDLDAELIKKDVDYTLPNFNFEKIK